MNPVALLHINLVCVMALSHKREGLGGGTPWMDRCEAPNTITFSPWMYSLRPCGAFSSMVCLGLCHSSSLKLTKKKKNQRCENAIRKTETVEYCEVCFYIGPLENHDFRCIYDTRYSTAKARQPKTVLVRGTTLGCFIHWFRIITFQVWVSKRMSILFEVMTSSPMNGLLLSDLTFNWAVITGGKCTLMGVFRGDRLTLIKLLAFTPGQLHLLSTMLSGWAGGKRKLVFDKLLMMWTGGGSRTMITTRGGEVVVVWGWCQQRVF